MKDLESVQAQWAPGADNYGKKFMDSKLDAEMKQRLQASLDAIQAIPGPFDQAIAGADNAEVRQKVKAAIDALKAQTDTLVDVATALGITLNLE